MRAFTLCIFMQEYNTYGYFRFLQSLSLSLLHSSRKLYVPAANAANADIKAEKKERFEAFTDTMGGLYYYFPFLIPHSSVSLSVGEKKKTLPPKFRL